MPSPFPGMDPYLEGSLGMSDPTQLSAEIARQLAPKLRPRYLALTTERFLLESPDSISISPATLFPDVAVARTGRETTGGGALTLAPPPLRLETVMPVPVPHVTVEIRDTAQRQLVTVIEVLSPTNKRGSGFEEYVAKRQRILMSSSHLLEIDLLHEGRRVPMKEPLPEVPYFVFLSRAGQRPITEVWPLSLAERLPEVPVPLLPGDSDVALDLQLALSNVYDAVGYDLAIDYCQPPPPTLSQEEARWTEALLASFSATQPAG